MSKNVSFFTALIRFVVLILVDFSPPLGTHMQGSRLNFYTGVPNISIYLPSCSSLFSLAVTDKL